MHAVPEKGLDSVGYAAECLSKIIMALGHARCVVRSDNKPSIVRLVKAAIGKVRLGGIDVVDEGAVPYDPQTNGQAESAVRLLKGAMRVHQLSLEKRLKAHIAVHHPVMAWLALHVALLRTTQVIGTDGLTAWQRVRGRVFNQNLHLLGEVVRYKCRAQEGGIRGAGGPRFCMGVRLGFDRHTTQNIIFDLDNGGICYARTLISLPDPQKIDVDRIAAVSSSPCSIHQNKEEHSVLAPKGTCGPQ